ncbi:hypothetical protein PMAYCL1PPCAC_17626 [Pristionchus mayeri]|uniref:Uncharacterized protein n=1 Tax=Pristionchus mayeri TaxID=1317129 RepID=A0AAN5I177_9BILA|nr:hypothetical protein PMAYCL1PPCAC_17626 [Pristionchus mayeri]
MHLLPLLIVVSISAIHAFPLEEEEAPRSLSLMYSKRGRELFGKRSMPFEIVTGQKRGRELFGKRSGPPMSFTLQEKRKGRELFGKRSGSPPILSLEYDNENSSEEEQRLIEALAKNIRERRAKMKELLG